MPTLSAREIAGVAAAAGFNRDANTWTTAVAVALAESGGRTDVVNRLGCVGLWQVYQSVHVKAHPTWTTAWLKNPRNNAQAAYVLSNGGRNWKPWETYTTGAYKLHWQEARQAIQDPTDITHDTRIPGNKGTPFEDSSLGNIIGFGKFVTDAHNWARAGLFIAGSILLIIALFKMTGDNQLSGTTKAIASAAITKGVVK